MGNSSSSSASNVSTSPSVRNPDESGRTEASPPASLDLSHLTNNEKAKIQNVFTRQLSFERKEQARIETLKKEMIEFERSVLAASNPSSPSFSDGLCAICRTAPLMDGVLDVAMGGSGERCDSCGRVCCLNCGKARTSKTTQGKLWVCFLCERRYQFIMKSGLWFGLKDSCPTVAHFGLQLHDKPVGGEGAVPDSQNSMNTLSPEMLPSIMVTRPSVKGKKSNPSKGLVVINDSDESGITAPASSDSDECGGFTPPPVESPYIVEQESPRSQLVDELKRDEGSAENSVNEDQSNRSEMSISKTHPSPSKKTESQSLSYRSPGEGKDDGIAQKPWLSPLTSTRRKKAATPPQSEAAQNFCIETDSNYDKGSDGYELDDDRPLSPMTWDRVRERARTTAEKEIRKKMENRWSLNASSSKTRNRHLPYSPVPKNSKPWTSAASAVAARKQQKSAVERMQPGERPYRIHLADLGVPVDKGVELSDEKVSKMLEYNEALYAVGGCQLNGSRQQNASKSVKETLTDDALRQRASSTDSCGAQSVISDDPDYARIGPSFVGFVHSETPTANEVEPGYAVVNKTGGNNEISELGRSLDHANDETSSLGEVRASIMDKQTGDHDHEDDDDRSVGEVNEPGYARVKILALGDSGGGETEMVIVVDNDSDNEVVGYSRVSKQEDSEEELPDPGYQSIADARHQATALLTQGEVDALYSKVIKTSKTEGTIVDDPSALYSKVMKVKVRDPSALYSKVNKRRGISPLYSEVHKQQVKETESDTGEESGLSEVTVDDVTALYARVVKRKKDIKEDKEADDRSKERKPRRRLPKLPSDDEPVSLRERTKQLEKKLLRLSRGLGEDEEETGIKMEKSRASQKDIPQSSRGLVKQRMAFFNQHSNVASDSEDTIRRKRRGRTGLTVNSSASVSSSVESYASDSMVYSRALVASPGCLSPTDLSPRQSVGEEVVASPGATETDSSDVQVSQGLLQHSVEKALSVSPLLSMENEMQRTWPRVKKDKGKPPVSPNLTEETFRVVLHKKGDGEDDALFGLNFEAKPGIHRLYISKITAGSVASQCSKISIGDELLLVDGQSFSNGDISSLMQYLNRVDQVKLRLRKRPKQGVAFKEKVREQQRLRQQDKFSLVESYRLSGSEMSLNSSIDSTGEGEHVKDQNVTIEKCNICTDTDGCEDLERGVANIVENGGNLAKPAKSNTRAIGSRQDVTYSTVHDRDERVMLRDKGKKVKKKGIWKRFSSALTKKGLTGSVDDLTRLSDSFVVLKVQRRIGSMDNVFQEQRPHTFLGGTSGLDQSVTTESRMTVSSGNSHESGSTVPSVASSPLSPPLSRAASAASAASEPLSPLQFVDYKLGQGQVLDREQTGKTPLAVGEIELSVMYHESRMTVEIIKALNLHGQNRQNAQIPYVKVYLVSSTTHQRLAKRKTRKAATRPVDPAFYEQLYFSESDLRDKYLHVMVWRQEGSGVFAKNRCIGRAILSLDGLDLSSKVQDKYSLFALPCQKPGVMSPTNRTM